MHMTFLGTSAGVPTRQRNVSGLALGVDHHRDWYLVDAGEGTQHQLLRSGHSLARLRAIFISHVHGDHCYGLPGIIASANMSGRKTPLTICAPDGIEQYVNAVRKYTDLHTLRYPLHFVRSDHCAAEQALVYQDENVSVSAHALSHRVPSFAYRFEELPASALDHSKLEALAVPRGPLWGQLQQGQVVTLADGRKINPQQVIQPAWKARRVIVGGDNDQPELLLNALKNVNLLIHEATFTDDILQHVGPQYMHSTASMVAKIAERAGTPYLALTHFSQRYRNCGRDDKRQVEELRREAAQHFNGSIILAKDFDRYEIDRTGELKIVNNKEETKNGG
ncbi:MAG: ribonuclease [Spongiibacteraceae bacterium]|nr:ribonuclease [Spongiibacteraceae bacterium]